MKNNLLKLFILCTCLFSDFTLFSQAVPGGDTPTGDLEGGDPPPAPINSKLVLLAIAGIFFAIYTFKKNRKVV